MSTKKINKIRDSVQRIRQIETELAEGNFDDIDYFIDYAGQEALDYALEWTAFYGKIELVKKVILNGANINSSNNVCLQMACRNGHLDIVKYLVESGQLNKLSDSDILTEAVENKHTDIIKYLLDDNNIFGLSVCNVNVQHGCALRTAINNNYSQMVDLLIKYGSDVNIFDGCIIITATKLGNIDIIKLLINANIEKTNVMLAINEAKRLKYDGIASLLEEYLLKN